MFLFHVGSGVGDILNLHQVVTLICQLLLIKCCDFFADVMFLFHVREIINLQLLVILINKIL